MGKPIIDPSFYSYLGTVLFHCNRDMTKTLIILGWGYRGIGSPVSRRSTVDSQQEKQVLLGLRQKDGWNSVREKLSKEFTFKKLNQAFCFKSRFGLHGGGAVCVSSKAHVLLTSQSGVVWPSLLKQQLLPSCSFTARMQDLSCGVFERAVMWTNRVAN